MAVVELLAKANHLRNLPQIQEELVMSWLIADKVDDAYAVDPNDVSRRTLVYAKVCYDFVFRLWEMLVLIWA